MLRVTLWHTPQYFTFKIRDPNSDFDLDQAVADEVLANGVATRVGLVAIAVQSDCTSIPITVEYDADGPHPPERTDWDRIVECSLSIVGRHMVFESCLSDEFGRLEVQPGTYRLRVHFGGQSSLNEYGDADDFYLIQIWPSDDPSTVKIA